MVRYFLCASLMFVGGMGVGCSRQSADRTEADTRFEENKSLFAAIQNTGQVVLYEGLPRETFTREQIEEKKRQKQTVTLHGFSFYPTPLDVSEEDAAKLKGLLADERSFRQWIGKKACGGFHPDFLAEYRVGEEVYRFLVCFGCHEVMVFGPNRSLWCDIPDDTYKQLKELLKRYRKNNPVSQEP